MAQDDPIQKLGNNIGTSRNTRRVLPVNALTSFENAGFIIGGERKIKV